ncbi:PREDICTED: uncharacterized protein K02A2.6-like, partial [Rhagoletis zephyria]|uniref:uncharacterized protein K02A2.6-like n=1 Tax=Rhagoletis zephyria TaxID=28612 RepID=UPI000811627B
MKNVAAKKEYCAKLLLNSIGAKNFNTITALAAPKEVTELQYDELLKILEAHFSPKKNVLVAQHKFISKYQNDQQSVADFVTELRRGINECEFISPCSCRAQIADIFLRAQFIRGIHNNSIREQLQSGTCKFDEIFSKALALKAAKMDARELAHGTQNVSNSTDINKITFKKKSKPLKSQSKSRSSPKSSTINYAELGMAWLMSAVWPVAGHYENKTNQIQSEDSQYGIYKVVDAFCNDYTKASSERYYAKIVVEGKPIKFEVDSGSAYSFLPRSQFSELKLSQKLIPINIVFRSYTQDTFVPDGKIRVHVQFNEMAITDDLYAVPDRCSAILGRTWIRRLKINLNELDGTNCNIVTTTFDTKAATVQDLTSKFPSVFEEKIGCIPNYKVSLKLREGATPVYTKDRQIPYALLDRLDKELDELEKANIITKTNNSDWGSPLVVIPKPDGIVRLCVDYKVGVNRTLVDAHYPIRRIDQIFNNLRDSKYFCRLDLYKAYLHVPVDEESSQIQTISTHKGTYLMNRLSFGIKTAPAEFNRIIDQILRDVPNTESYFDDIVVHGKSMVKCKANLEACLNQLDKYDLHLNIAK